MTLDLSQFAAPPPPKQTPPPQPQPIEPTPPPTEPKPIPKKEIVKEEPAAQQKIFDEKKLVAAKKADQENNSTKETEKTKEEIAKKEEKPKEKIVKSKPTPSEKKSPPKRQIAQKSPPPPTPAKRTAAKRQPAKQYTSPLANTLMGSSRSNLVQSAPIQQANSSTKNMINELYGSEFDGYSAEQKKFINDNLAIIHRITQMTLIRNGYPEVAARTGQQGVNVVSFNLHSNGNITDLRLEHSMGYELLDKNTLHVIRIAYKDYPLPQKKTKIKFFVQYSINRY